MKTISGLVTNEKGEPIENASVFVKGKAVGTMSKADGRFALKIAPEDSILVFSSINYLKKEIHVNGTAEVNVTLSSDNAASLNDVVVVGYGTQQRTSITGAVATVNNKLMRDRPVTNAVNALQGTAPGLIISRTSGQPGQEGWSMNIRGLTSLSGSNSPLVIIDGVPGDINSINPNDIANISILEDAAAAAIYGAKAGGGVVLVTTKNGSGVQKPRLELSNIYTVRKPYARPEMISSGDQALLQNYAQQNTNGQTPNSPQQIAWMNDPDTNYVWNTGTKGYDWYYNYNLEDMLMRNTSPQDNANVSISGSTNKSSYLFSFGYVGQDGVFKFGPDNYKRYNARINYNTHITDKFSFDARISYAYQVTQAPIQGVTGDGLLYNIYQIRSARNPIWVPGEEYTDDYLYQGTQSSAYPILKDGGYNDLYTHTINGAFTLSANRLLPGLELRAVYAPGLVISSRNIFTKSIPRYTVDSSLNVIATPTSQWINPVNGLQKPRSTTITQDLQGLADYTWSINKDHHFHVLGGFEYQYYNYDYVFAQQLSLLLNDFPTLNYTTLPNASITNVGDNIQTYTYVSEFGKLDYNYKDKYYLQGIIRNDGTSRVAPQYRYKLFYGISGGWRLSQENWFKNSLSWVNELKLRASYGTNGLVQSDDNNTHNYDYQAVLSSGYYPFNDSRTAYIYEGALPATDKAWEVIKQLDFGLDFSLLNNKLSGAFDYYIRKNNNIFLSQQMPSTLGITPSSANIASLKVNGWTVNLSWNDVFRNGSYFISANVSDNKNVVTRYDGNYAYSAGINAYLPGMPANSIFGYKTDGYFNTQQQLDGAAVINSQVGLGDLRYVDVNGDGKITQGTNSPQDHGDLVYLGNTNPRYTFGINMGVTWKGFDISVLLQGTGKRTILSDPTYVMPFYDSWRLPWKIDEDYWTPEHTNALFPAYRIGDHTINTQVSTYYLQDASYIRLKNLQVGYTFNKKQLGGHIFESLKIYFSGQDLWEKTGMWFKYYDPENTDKIGFEYPYFRNFAFGINATF